jgi:cytochrome P450
MAAERDAMVPKTPAGDQQSLLDPEVMECPYPYYEALHASSEAVHHDQAIGWLVHRYADLVEIATDPSRFSNHVQGEEQHALMGVSPEPFSDEVTELIARLHPMANALLFADPPVHTRQRALVTKALSPRRVRAHEPLMRATAHALIDEFIDDLRCELLAQFAIPLPLTMLADTLGVERADIGQFKGWTAHFAQGLIGVMDNAQRAAVARSLFDFQQYMLPRMADRRREPRDDLLSALVNAEIDFSDLDEQRIEGPRHLTDAEVLPIMVQLLTAGNHTTTDTIGNGMVLLLQHPETMAELRSDFGLIPSFIEEALRFDPPAHCTVRIATASTEVGGTTVPSGAMVSCLWGAANQDPSVFANPRTFDIHRDNVRKHLVFGHGPHFCAGAEFARTELRIAFEVLLGRLDDIRLAAGAGLEHIPQFTTRGYREIPLEFSKSGA